MTHWEYNNSKCSEISGAHRAGEKPRQFWESKRDFSSLGEQPRF